MNKDLELDNEINDLADKLIKSKKKEEQTVDKDLIKSIIMDMTKDELKEAIPTLEKSEQEVVFEILNDLKKAKSESFDKEAEPKTIRPKLMDLRQDEDYIDQKEDEKLVKESAKDVKPQGDNSPEEIKGEVIKSEDKDDEKSEDMEKAEDRDKPEVKMIAKEEAKEEVKDHEDKMHEKKPEIKKSEPKFQWESSNRLFKSNVLGRNFGLSINEYYDQALNDATELTKSNPKEESKEVRAIDINDVIAKSMDTTQTHIEELIESENAEFDKNGTLVKSIDDEAMAKMCGVSTEDLKKIK